VSFLLSRPSLIAACNSETPEHCPLSRRTLATVLGCGSSTLMRSVVSIGLALGKATIAAAGTYTVTSVADDNSAGTLRYAIINANYTPGSVIQFAAGLNGQTITLTGGQIPVKASMTIQGLGSGNLTISGNNASRIFQAYTNGATPLNVGISGVALITGNAGSGKGGAVYAKNINLNLQDVVLTNNHAQLGGAVYATGSGASCTLTSTTLQNNTAGTGGGLLINSGTSVQISNSVFDQNHASSGGAGALSVTNIGSVSIGGSQITNNQAHGSGGGLASDYSPVQISGSTISGNTAGVGAPLFQGKGGGVWVHNSNFTLTDSSVSNNGGSGSATYYGGGIYLRDSRSTAQAVLDVERSTISGNTALLRGGGIDAGRAGSVTVGKSLLSSNSATGSFANGGGGLAIGVIANSVYLHDSTFYQNSAFGYGGGIDIFNATTGNASTLKSLTIVGNSTQANPGNGIRALGAPTLDSAIVANNINTANNAGSQDLDGTFKVTFSDIKKKGTATFAGGSGNNLVDGTDPSLGALAMNGGPTKSLLPNIGSPVLDKGDTAITSGLDQRGFPRVVSNHADVGAVELQNPEDVIFQDDFELQ